MADNSYEINFEFRNQRFNSAAAGLRYFAQQLESDWDGSAKVLSAQLKKFLDTVALALAKRHGGAWPGGTTAQTISKRSGNSIQSIVNSVLVSGASFDQITGQIGGAWPLHVHEFGATINSKGKLLTIPLPAALDSHGVPKKKSAREWQNTFVARSKAGNLIIFQRQGKTEITPLYVLKKSVTIPPRLGMRATLNAGLPYFVDQSMDAMVKAITSKS